MSNTGNVQKIVSDTIMQAISNHYRAVSNLSVELKALVGGASTHAAQANGRVFLKKDLTLNSYSVVSESLVSGQPKINVKIPYTVKLFYPYSNSLLFDKNCIDNPDILLLFIKWFGGLEIINVEYISRHLSVENNQVIDYVTCYVTFYCTGVNMLALIPDYATAIELEEITCIEPTRTDIEL